MIRARYSKLIRKQPFKYLNQVIVALILTIYQLNKTAVYTSLSTYNANMMVLGAGPSLIALYLIKTCKYTKH